MITFYHAPYSCSLAVKAALAASGVDFVTKIINLGEGEHLTPEFLKINPLAKVPAIEVGGDILTEGAAINLYLAEKFPSANLMPENGSIEKANALKWLQFMYSTLHPAFVRAFFPERHGDNNIFTKKLAEQDIHKLLTLVDKQLSETDFVAGDQMTLADLYLMTVIHWESVLETPIIKTYKNIARFEQKMFTENLVGDVFTQEYAA